MNGWIDEMALGEQNRIHGGSGGVSAVARGSGFCPAFIDGETGAVYRSCYANGEPAPFHLLDGLPAEVVKARHPSGRVAAVKGSVVAGFLQGGRFYTREQAALAVASAGEATASRILAAAA